LKKWPRLAQAHVIPWTYRGDKTISTMMTVESKPKR
jgi:hypothetical protein